MTIDHRSIAIDHRPKTNNQRSKHKHINIGLLSIAILLCELTLTEWPKQPAPLCSGVDCIQEVVNSDYI